MGLDASVGCRCWRDGLAAVPHDQIVQDFAWILDALVTVLRAAVETGNSVR